MTMTLQPTKQGTVLYGEASHQGPLHFDHQTSWELRQGRLVWHRILRNLRISSDTFCVNLSSNLLPWIQITDWLKNSMTFAGSTKALGVTLLQMKSTVTVERWFYSESWKRETLVSFSSSVMRKIIFIECITSTPLSLENASECCQGTWRSIISQDRRQRAQLQGKCFKMADVFSNFSNQIRIAYEPSAHLCIDECLYPFRGHCSFIQYMPQKPAKYGLKFWVMSDCESSIIVNILPYSGKEGGVVQRGLAQRVVMQLSSPFANQWRNITFDNYYTSVALAEELWKNKFTSLGTLKPNS